MIDEAFNTLLIEVNTNPCLETPCSLLSTIISSVLDHTFRVTLDPMFPAPDSVSGSLIISVAQPAFKGRNGQPEFPLKIRINFRRSIRLNLTMQISI